LTSRFQFDTGIDAGKNYVLVDAGTQIVLTFDLSPGSPGTFAQSPVLWNMSPSNGQGEHDEPQVIPSGDGRRISFTVPPPTSYFIPWIFRLRIDAELNGITSPTFYIVRHPSSDTEQDCTLTYDPSDGSFTLSDGLTLGHLTGLFNTISPFKIRIALEGASFPPDPIVWSTGTKPDWMWVCCDSADSLTFTIPAAAYGETAGFQLIVEHDGHQVLSPDPVLINATLGDG
jgi:hypothetical protein